MEYYVASDWIRNSYTMAKTFEKAYAISGHSPLLVTKLMFPLSSTPVTVAAMQFHTSWVLMSRMPGVKQQVVMIQLLGCFKS